MNNTEQPTKRPEGRPRKYAEKTSISITMDKKMRDEIRADKSNGLKIYNFCLTLLKEQN